jgi:hypothetical protein
MLSQSNALFIRSVCGATLRAKVGQKNEQLSFIDRAGSLPWAHFHAQDCAEGASQRATQCIAQCDLFATAGKFVTDCRSALASRPWSIERPPLPFGTWVWPMFVRNG